MNHEKGSLEEVVENLVKTWEMEATHKIDFDQVKNLGLISDMSKIWTSRGNNLGTLCRSKFSIFPTCINLS